jgi:hypothetical protein
MWIKPDDKVEHITNTDGSEYWYKAGALHREDGPAVILPGNVNLWYFEGRCCGLNEIKRLKLKMMG